MTAAPERVDPRPLDLERDLERDLDVIRRSVPPEGDPQRMLPATAYTSEAVLDWERRHLFAGSWTCLGREDEVLAAPTRSVTQRSVMVGDVHALLVADAAGAEQGSPRLRLFANTCRHRGHELLGAGETSTRASIICPYHAWTFALDGSLRAAPGLRDAADFDADEFGLVELPLAVWGGWVFAHARHRLGSPEVPDFPTHLGAAAGILEPYATHALVVADRHTYEVAANWKVVAENYHECYHCPLIHPELCRVSPPDSGDNYDLPGAWVGGAMILRDGMATMSITGELAATPLPGVDPERIEYIHLLPNLLVSAHPDYVMTHRLVPLAPGRTWIECSWLVLPSGGAGADGEDSAAVPDASRAVEFWDITNRQDWAACESVQRGLSSPHFAPGPFAPNEDAVARLVAKVGRAYHGRPLT
jgi:glycine betaine catabolism A